MSSLALLAIERGSSDEVHAMMLQTVYVRDKTATQGQSLTTIQRTQDQDPRQTQGWREKAPWYQDQSIVPLLLYIVLVTVETSCYNNLLVSLI